MPRRVPGEELWTKVTRIGNRWHVRLYQNDEVRDEMACANRIDIKYCCRWMLRWHDKLGGMSQMADRSRHRNKPLGNNSLDPLGRIWYPKDLPIKPSKRNQK